MVVARCTGAAGLLVIVAAAALLALDVWPVTIFVTPIVWTGYILAVDAAVFGMRGESLLRTHRLALAWMAVLSVGLWLIFEAYNLRLQNWDYRGLPESRVLRTAGYVWSFATIWPAILETAALLLATKFGKRSARSVAAPRGCDRGALRGGDGGTLRHGDEAALREEGGAPSRLLVAAGALALILPAVLPRLWSSYLFGLVWMGFVLLLDPLNDRAGRPSISRDLREGRHGRPLALLVAGVICGFLWEFWNYWATAKWVYVFPIGQGAKIFEMPLPGYLGFPVFAVEVFVMYVYAAGTLRIPCYEIR